MLLSIIIPVHNEQATLATLVDRVRSASLPASLTREIVLIDDASTDESAAIIQRLASEDMAIKAVVHERNTGKGGALHSGFALASGEYLLIQDADLEYDPADYPRLLEPILAGEAEAVIGSRLRGEGRDSLRAWQRWANVALTRLSNLFTGQKLTDMECCYKVLPTSVVRELGLREKRFGFEPEIVAKLSRRGVKLAEVPVGYRGRSYARGKKIGPIDALRAVYCIVRYSLCD